MKAGRIIQPTLIFQIKVRNDMCVDYQKSAVYEWENKFYLDFVEETCFTCRLALDTCKRIVFKICLLYDIHLPKYISKELLYAEGGEEEIVIPNWARNLPVLLHESTHVVVFSLNKKFKEKRSTLSNIYKDPGHGKVYMKIYIDLISYFYQIPKCVIKNSIDYFNNSPERYGKRKVRVEEELNIVTPKISRMIRINRRLENRGFFDFENWYELLIKDNNSYIDKGYSWDARIV